MLLSVEAGIAAVSELGTAEVSDAAVESGMTAEGDETTCME